jgi:non-canonical (house-cleaning) NTP pyrophosphatase
MTSMNTQPFPVPETVDAYLDRLSALSQEFGLGIEGGTIYVLEQEDHSLRYGCDEISDLYRKN